MQIRSQLANVLPAGRRDPALKPPAPIAARLWIAEQRRQSAEVSMRVKAAREQHVARHLDHGGRSR